MSITVRAYDAASDKRSNTTCIVEAFRADPSIRVLIPTDKEYNASFPRTTANMVWALGASYGMSDVAVDKKGQICCSALWEPGAMTFMGALRFIYMFGAMFVMSGFVKTLRAGAFFLALEGKRHKHAPTADHLQILGTLPTEQSKGFGGQNIKRGIERATAKGVPCYLESTNARNVPFYKRHGFRVVEEYYHWEKEGAVDGDGKLVKGRGPVVTLMIRDVESSAAAKKAK